MAIRNFPSDLGWTQGAGNTDSGPLNLGTFFQLTAAANVTGVRFYSPNSQTITAQLWANTTKVGETTGFSATSGWNTINFSSPIACTTGVDYIVSILLPSGSIQYTSVSPKFTDGTSSVVVTVGPATSNTGLNNLFTYGTGIPATSSSTNGPWYGVDAVIDDLVSGDTSVTAVRSTGSGLARPPSVSGTGAISVTAVKATAIASAQIPSVDSITTLTGGSPVTGSGLLNAPSVSGSSAGGATVNAPRAIGLGQIPTDIFGGIQTAYDRINDLWAVATDLVPRTYDVINDLWATAGSGTADEIFDLWGIVLGPPTVNAGVDQAFEPNVVAKLNPTISSTPGTIAWIQTGGPAITMIGSGTNRAYLTPATVSGTTLTFQVSVTPSGGGSAVTDTVVHTIYPQQMWMLNATRTKVPVFFGGTPVVTPDPDL